MRDCPLVCVHDATHTQQVNRYIFQPIRDDHCNSPRIARIYKSRHAIRRAVSTTMESLYMPDWMESKVHITGPADGIDRFRSAHIREDKDGNDTLDFDTITPMPAVLKNTEPGAYDEFIWALGGELDAARNVLRQFTADDTPLGWRWVRNLGITTREEFLQWAKMNRPDQMEAARRAMENERTTGYRDWLDWQVDNWGCKVGPEIIRQDDARRDRQWLNGVRSLIASALAGTHDLSLSKSVRRGGVIAPSTISPYGR